MEFLNEMTKEQLQLLITLVAHSSFSVSNSDNLSLEMVNLDEAFEHFQFKNPIDKRMISTNPVDYIAELVNPVLNPIINHYEMLYGDI